MIRRDDAIMLRNIFRFLQQFFCNFLQSITMRLTNDSCFIETFSSGYVKLVASARKCGQHGVGVEVWRGTSVRGKFCGEGNGREIRFNYSISGLPLVM